MSLKFLLLVVIDPDFLMLMVSSCRYGFFHGEESNSEPPNFKDSGDKTPTAPRTPEPSINDIVSENVPDY